MTSKYELKALLNALQRLYARITSLALNRRMGSYRKEAGTVADHDLSALLSDHIDRVAASRRADGEKIQPQVSAPENPTATHTPSPARRDSGRRVPIVGRAFGGLGRYFRSRRTESVVDPELSKKLKTSTWNHIHTALRLARQGEERTAKLHLDFASQALKEAAHYMSKEEYLAFTVEVEEKLAEITGQGMDLKV